MPQRSRLVLILGATVAPLLVLAVWLLWRESNATEENIALERVALARTGALIADSFLEGNRRLLEALAIEFRGADAQPEGEVQERLQDILQTHPRWFGMGIFDDEGVTLRASWSDPGDLNVSDRGYFQQTLATRGTVVGSAMIGRVSQQPSVVVATPIVLSDGSTGVLAAAILLTELAEDLEASMGMRDVRTSVIDNIGQTIIHPDPERVRNLAPVGDRPEVVAARSGRNGSMVLERLDGEVLVAYAPVPSADWVVLVTESTSAAFAPARNALVSGAGMVAAAGAGVLGVGWVLGGVISRSYAAERRARGDANLARRLAQESQQRYADLVDGLDGVVWEADADTLHFTFVSPAIEDLLGFPLAEWERQPPSWPDHAVPEDREFILAHCVAEAREEGAHSCEYRAYHADGREIWLADVIRTVVDAEGHPTLLRGIMIDATIRKRSEEDRASLLAAEQLARAEAEEALRSRDEFLSIASHELRNPVAAIKGTGQLLLRFAERGRLTDEARDEYMGSIVKTSERLARLVEDLLDVSRLQGGQFQLHRERVDLADLLHEAATVEGLQGREVRMPPQHPCYAVVDPDRVQQVLQNLLENAAKYSPADTPIEVVMRRNDRTVSISVTDRGIGLPEDANDTLFVPFGRTQIARDSNIPGMGLGLYVSRQIAEAHGGRLEASSPGEGLGSTFTLTLPIHGVEIADGGAPG